MKQKIPDLEISETISRLIAGLTDDVESVPEAPDVACLMTRLGRVAGGVNPDCIVGDLDQLVIKALRLRAVIRKGA